MHKGMVGVCLPDVDIVYMQLGVQWRSMSDVRARDGGHQGHNSRKLREPGKLGVFLLYAAVMCIPQSCVILGTTYRDPYKSCVSRPCLYAEMERAGWSAAVAGLLHTCIVN